jgi:hypothetical protein
LSKASFFSFFSALSIKFVFTFLSLAQTFWIDWF